MHRDVPYAENAGRSFRRCTGVEPDPTEALLLSGGTTRRDAGLETNYRDVILCILG